MLIEALFTTPRTREQPKCQLTAEWIKKARTNAIFRNMVAPGDYHTKWSQKGKDKYHMISLICGIKNIAKMKLSTKQNQIYRPRE